MQHMQTGKLKKYAIGGLKIAISTAILAYLFYRASHDESFAALRDQPKHWGLLLAALLVFLVNICSNMIRWYLLVRALELPFTLRDAFRLGFVSYLFNFFTVGIVGGDLIKAVFIAHQQPGRRTEAVATVAVDRIVGMYAMFLVASAAFLFSGLQPANVRDPVVLSAIQRICQATILLSAIGTIGLGLLLVPGFTTWPLWDLLVGLPRVGKIFDRLIGAVRMYRKRVGVLAVTLLMSLSTHALAAVGIYLIALGLPGDQPSLATHFVIVPISNVAGVLPLPGGLGAFEYALDLLYRGVSTVAVAQSQGFVIALAYRVITILIAMIGVVYYLTSRREVTELIKEAQANDEPQSRPKIP
jgi:uncharacterized membrane protein YbhN (UPF0104 family)